jgi:hypothetical protein
MPTWIIGSNIGSLFLRNASARRIADGNALRSIIESALMKALKNGAPICVKIPFERVLFEARAIGATEVSCSKRIFGGRAWVMPRRSRGPTSQEQESFLDVPRRSRGSATLPPCVRKAWSGRAGPVARERDPTATCAEAWSGCAGPVAPA